MEKNNNLKKKRPDFKFNSEFYKATLPSFPVNEDCLGFPLPAQNELQNKVNTIILLVLINHTLSLMGDGGAGKPTTGNYEMPARQSLT